MRHGRRDLNCAWYQVTRADRALSAFSRGLVATLRHVVNVPTRGWSAVDSWSVSGSGDRAQAETVAGLLCESLQENLIHDLILVVEDVHVFGPHTASMCLLESMCRNAPATLHLVLTSRVATPFPMSRLRGQGQVLELGAAALTFSAAEVAAILADVVGEDSLELSDEVCDVTGGWPAAVRLAVESLRGVRPDERAGTLKRLARPGIPLFEYLADEVFQREPEPARRLLEAVAPLERFTPELCEFLGVPTRRSC